MNPQQVERFVTDPPDAQPCSVCYWHVGIGAAIAVIGFVMMLTGALAGFGVVTLTIGILYAVIAWAITMLPSRPRDPDAIP